MKQTITLNRNERLMLNVQRIANLANKPLAALANYYSRLLGEKVNVRQTLLLCNAQAAFFFLVFASMSLVLRLLCLLWFATHCSNAETADLDATNS